jgi:PAS domain S-box-containing protein
MKLTQDQSKDLGVINKIIDAYSKLHFDKKFDNEVLETNDGFQAVKNLNILGQKISALVTSSHDAIVSQSMDGLILSWNQGAERLYGYPANEVLGKSIDMLFAEDRRQELVDIREDIKAGEEFCVCETQRRHKSGHLIDVKIMITPVKNRKGEVEEIFVVTNDITEQKAYEETLQESEERFRYAALATSDSIYDWDLETNGVWRDQTYQKLFCNGEMIGADNTWFASRLHPDDEPLILASIDEALRDNSTFWKGDYRFKRSDGTYAYVEDSGYIIRNMDGLALRIIGAMSDVTVRKEAELASRHLVAIIESSDDAILGITLTGIIMSWNRGAEKMYGYKSEEAIGKHISFVVPENKIKEIEMFVNIVKSGDTLSHYETYRTRKDGKDIPVSISVSPIENSEGELLGTSAITRDISERKEYIKKIKESEARFRYASLATSDSIYDWNVQTNHVWRNETYQKLFCPGEPIGTDDEWFASRLHPDDRDRVVETVGQALAGTNEIWEGEYRFRRADGEFSIVRDSGYIIRNEKGVAKRIIGAMTDITERRKFEKALREANDNLENKVLERTAELADKNEILRANYEELMRLNDDLDSFVHAASHDLKVPIVNMEALTMLLEKDKGLGERSLIVLDKMKTAISRVTKTIGSLSEATKARKNLYDDIESVSFARILDEILDDIAEVVVSANATIFKDFSAVDSVVFSKSGLRSILYNFVTNGVKYRDPNRKPVVNITTAIEGEFVVITIADNGLGINLEKHGKKLFAIFKRLHDHVEGTGVGLYLVKRIVDNNGGKIEVESELGVGTTFKIYLKKDNQNG